MLVEGLRDVLGGVVKPDKEAFPTNVGYAGPTPTGLEPALIITAPTIAPQLLQPPLSPPSPSSDGSHSKSFNLLQSFGHLSPWYSTDHGLRTTANQVVPDGCSIERVIWLQRHGARYPTSNPEGPASMADRLSSSSFKASGSLRFLNDWKYELGKEILTPFGRQQLFNLGVSARIKYGFLLDSFKDRLPVFRTESQDRMLKSAQNFAAGFFGIPAEEQYNLEVTIEWPGYNNTLAPYTTCAAEEWLSPKGDRLKQWDAVFLKDALKRLSPELSGHDLTIQDLKDMMETCAYETVSLGYSPFCSIFTEREWRGFNYRQDIMWWYTSSFGSPIARAEGMGWVQELISRLTRTRLTEFNSTTNSTLHNDVHFPLDDKLYIDFTHDTTFAQLLPTLNLTTFSSSGPPPLDHIPKHRSFKSSKFCPFATNLQFQVLSCNSDSFESDIRLILNDGVVPLTGLTGCPHDPDGKCPLDTFVSAVKTIVGEIDWAEECGSRDLDFEAPTVNGSPAR